MHVRKSTQKDRRLSGVQVVCYSRRGCPRQHGGNESTCGRRRARKANYPGDVWDLTLGCPIFLSSRCASWHQSPREIVSLECESYAVAKIEKNRRASRARHAPNVSKLSSHLSHWQTDRITSYNRRMNKFSSPIFFSRSNLSANKRFARINPN